MLEALSSELQALKGEYEQLNVELAEQKEQNLRLQAEFENFKKRTERDAEEFRQHANSRMVEGLLPVLDNFDLALMGNPETMTVESVLKGIVVTRDELLRVLDTHGVTILDPAPGDEFSPMHHQAVMQQDHEDVAPGAVVASLQKGYAMGERTLRPAKVSVKPQSSAPAPSGGEGDSQEGGADADV